MCAHCSKEGASFLCGNCKVFSYCSAACQKADWKMHKPNCVKSRNDVVVPAAGDGPQMAERHAPAPSLNRIQVELRLPLSAAVVRKKTLESCALEPFASNPSIALALLLHKQGPALQQCGGKLSNSLLRQAEALLKAGADPCADIRIYESAVAAAARPSWPVTEAPPPAGGAPDLTHIPARTPVKELSNAGSSALYVALRCGDARLLAAIKSHSTHALRPNQVYHVNGDATRVTITTMLCAAIASLDPGMVREVLALGADPNVAIGVEGMGDSAPHRNRLLGAHEATILLRPLHLLVNNPNGVFLPADAGVAMMRALKEAGAHMNAVNNEGNTLLHMLASAAIRADKPRLHAQVLALFRAALELGADPSIPSAAPSPLLRVLDVLAMARDPGLGKEKGPTSDIIIAFCEALLTHSGADAFKLHTWLASAPPPPGRHPGKGFGDGIISSANYVVTSILTGNLPLLRFAITRGGVDVNTRSSQASKMTLLSSAAQCGCSSSLRLLLELGADPFLRSSDAGTHWPETPREVAESMLAVPAGEATMRAMGADRRQVEECVRLLTAAEKKQLLLRGGGSGSSSSSATPAQPLSPAQQDEAIETWSTNGASLSELLTAATRGDGAAQFLVGTRAVMRGDAAKASKWLLASASAGFYDAQSNLAMSIYDGMPGAGTRDDALEWLRKAAAQGSGAAMVNLGAKYAHGEAGTGGKDVAMALELYHKALVAPISSHGSAEALIGGCFERGEGVPRDAVKAFEWYQKAAAPEEFPGAMFDLARCYVNGVGTAVDVREGARWMQKAAAAGHPGAKQNLPQLQRFL